MDLAPFTGYTVGVTADRRREELAGLLERRGARTIVGPVLATQLLHDDGVLHAVTRALIDAPPDIVVLTTGIGVRAWFEAAHTWGLSDALVAALDQARVIARGPKAAAAAQLAGLSGVTTGGDAERLADIVDSIQRDAAGSMRIAIQRHGDEHLAAVGELRLAGAHVTEIPVYRWALPADPRPALRLVDAICDGRVDAVTFTSAPAVRHLLAIARAAAREDAMRAVLAGGSVVAACVGPQCAEVATAEGFAMVVAPAAGRLGLLVRVLGDALADRRSTVAVGVRRVILQGSAIAVDGGSEVLLGDRERRMFAALAERPGVVVSRGALLRQVWGAGARDPHVVDVALGRLRRRLASTGLTISTVRGRGYRLADAV